VCRAGRERLPTRPDRAPPAHLDPIEPNSARHEVQRSPTSPAHSAATSDIGVFWLRRYVEGTLRWVRGMSNIWTIPPEGYAPHSVDSGRRRTESHWTKRGWEHWLLSMAP
jgi:hypothetical protein